MLNAQLFVPGVKDAAHEPYVCRIAFATAPPFEKVLELYALRKIKRQEFAITWLLDGMASQSTEEVDAVQALCNQIIAAVQRSLMNEVTRIRVFAEI